MRIPYTPHIGRDRATHGPHIRWQEQLCLALYAVKHVALQVSTPNPLQDPVTPWLPQHIGSELQPLGISKGQDFPDKPHFRLSIRFDVLFTALWKTMRVFRQWNQIWLNVVLQSTPMDECILCCPCALPCRNQR